MSILSHYSGSDCLWSCGLYPTGSSLHGILQARILEWVAVPLSRGCSQARDRNWMSYIAGRFFIISVLGKPFCLYVLSQSYVWLFCDPMDCSPPGFSVHEITQVRILDWVSLPSYRGSSRPRGQTNIALCFLCWQASSLPPAPFGKGREKTLPQKVLYWHVDCFEWQAIKIEQI